MADGNHLKSADPVDLADDDPFAELTRIMGFDPRQPAKPAALASALAPLSQPASAPVGEQEIEKAIAAAQPDYALADEDDFSIDLEKELMGEFSADDDDAGLDMQADDIHLDATPATVVAHAAEAARAAEDADAAEAAHVAAMQAAEAAHAAEVAAAAEAAHVAEATHAAEEAENSDFDFDFSEGFDAAIAASADDDDAGQPAAEAVESIEAFEAPQPAAQAEISPLAANTMDDDTEIAAEFDAAMADIDMDFGSDPKALAQAAEPEADAVEDAEDEQAFVAAADDAEDEIDELELPLLDAADLHLDHEEIHLDEDELRLDDGSDGGKDERRVEDGLSFDDVDFADGIEDDVAFAGEVELEAAPVAETDEPEEAAIPVLPLKVARTDVSHMSPMDAAAAEYREREADPFVAADFNLEDELNALLGNSKAKAEAVAEPASDDWRPASNAWHNDAAGEAPTTAVEQPSDDWRPGSNDWQNDAVAEVPTTAVEQVSDDWRPTSNVWHHGAAGEVPVTEVEQQSDGLDWQPDGTFEPAAAADSLEDDLQAAYAGEDLPDEYAEDSAPELYAREIDVADEADVEDNEHELYIDAAEFEDDLLAADAEDYQDAAADALPLAAAEAYDDETPVYAAPADETPVFDESAFDAAIAGELDAGSAQDTFTYPPEETAPKYEPASRLPERFSAYRQADTTGRASDPYVSPHRDPVVRGDPLKEDPLDVIAALAAKYSKPLPPPSYGRANTVAAPAAEAAPAAYGQFDDAQDSDDAIDFSASFEDAPEIETVEVADRAVALADDLDIPELAYEDDLPPVSAYDDLDTEFSNLLNDMNAVEPAPERPAAQADDGYDEDFAAPEQDYPTDTIAPVAAARHASTIPGAYDDGQYRLDVDDLPGSRPVNGGPYGTDDYDYDPDLDNAISVPGIAAVETRAKPARRGLMLAAIAGGVAIVGGLGAFALSFGDGGGSDTPAIVMADDTPIKVKPENPGGTTVPNQESKVYDTVSGDGSKQPQQEKLVTTAEEPVDMTVSEPDAAADEEMASGAAKGEDRIEQILQEAENQSDSEIAAISPRKVRTMVVKPDGTLVPRDDPQPAEAIVPADQPEAAASAQDTLASISAPEATGALPAVSDEAAAMKPAAAPADEAQIAPEVDESTDMPDSVPIAPMRPVDQPIDVVGEVKADQVASAATAAGGTSWSMQIASQPSEAAAQSSYQDLARRYGSVLEGRPVNIVKAEIAGKGTFWRVRVPAKTRNDAISLCESYKASGGNCFVSR